MRALRIMLILALAFGLAPRFAGGGETICGLDVAVAYDFEKGAPVAPEPERCDHCTLAKALPAPEPQPAPGLRLAAERAAPAAAKAQPAQRPASSAQPRAPPLPA